MNEVNEKIEWSIKVPIFRNTIILKQLGFAIGIPFGILIFIMIIAKAYYALILIAALFLGTYLLILAIWGGKYYAGFELDRSGIRNFTMKDHAKKSLIINSLAVIGGLFSGKPTIAGAGILAQSRQDLVIKWRSIRKVKFYPRSQTVMIKAGFGENIALFCNDTNYAYVESFILQRLKGKEVLFINKGENLSEKN
ncbi:MAG TPA: hypothetical protein VMV47_10430 [Bacteroidales bacterium]|nr:hypothetical protein [Bacteroidales bacterium]